MLAWVLLVANMPTIVCTICSAFLAYKAAMGLVRRVGGARRHRRAADARRRARTTARMAIVSEKGRTQSGPRRKIGLRQVRP